MGHLWGGLSAAIFLFVTCLAHVPSAQAVSTLNDKEFSERVSELAASYGLPPSFLLHVFKFETAGTYSPSVRNPRSGAVGLIQFTELTAKELGTSTDELAAMSAIEQLVFVERYLDRTPLKKLPTPTLTDLYIAVLAPKYVLSDNDTTIFERNSSSLAYRQNIELDVNKDGKITRGEVDGVITGSIGLGEAASLATDASEGFVDIKVNGSVHAKTAYVYQDPSGRNYISLEDFAALGFSKAIDPITMNDTELIPLSDDENVTLEVDFGNSVAALTVPADWYGSTEIDLEHRHDLATVNPSEGILGNYVVELGSDFEEAYSALGLLSLSKYTDYGVFETTVGLKWRTDDSLLDIIKGDSFFLREDFEKRTFLRIGDGLSPAGPGTRSTRMAGVSYGSNFSLDPTFNPYLSYAYSGEALLPTKVDFVRDGRPVGSSLDLQPGPFEISNLPVVDGSGDLTVRLTDETGTTKEVTIPYFRSTRLFKKGVHDYNYAVGVRRDDGYEYVVDEPFAAMSHRYGLTDRLTASGSVLIDLEGAKGGFGFAYPVLNSVMIESFGALSYDNNGVGYSVGGRLSPFGADHFIDFGLSAEFASETFLHSDEFDEGETRSSVNGYIGKSLNELGRFGLFSSYRQYWRGEADFFGGVNWSRRLFDGLSANMELGFDTDDFSAMLGFNFALPDRDSFVSSRTGSEEGRSYVGAQYVKQRPQRSGVGYQIGAYREAGSATDERNMLDGKIYARNSVGDYAGSLRLDGNEFKAAGRAAGSLSVVDKNMYLGPPAQGVVAIVDTGDIGNVPVYKWNTEVGATNSNGKMALTNLTTGSQNKITILPEDVPMDYKVAKTEIQFIPQRRGFYFLDYGVSKQRSAIVVLQSSTGQFIPAGARVTVVETGEEAWVVSDGEAYFEHLPHRSHLIADLGNEECRVDVVFEQTEDPQPTIGPLECVALTPNTESIEAASGGSIY